MTSRVDVRAVVPRPIPVDELKANQVTREVPFQNGI
jgi:hypothetical protein